MFAKRAVIEAWLKDGIPRWGGEGKARRFDRDNPVRLQPFADQNYWIVISEMRWQSSTTTPSTVEVPLQFVTDFASIPQPFWSVLPKTGLYGLPAIIHDWLYWEQSHQRSDADKLFDAASADMKVPLWQRAVIYRAVRLFGSFAWRGNKVAKARGEKRVLREVPNDSTVTWDEWRKRPEVFV